MVLVFYGPSCSGKSSAARSIAERTGATIWTGKDYLRLAKTEPAAWKEFVRLLARAARSSRLSLDSIVFVTTDPATLMRHVGDLGTVYWVRFDASLETLAKRFALRIGGSVSPPMRTMLERSREATLASPADLLVDSTERTQRSIVEEVLRCCQWQ